MACTERLPLLPTMFGPLVSRPYISTALNGLLFLRQSYTAINGDNTSYLDALVALWPTEAWTAGQPSTQVINPPS